MSDATLQLPEAQAPLGDELDAELLTVSTKQVKRQRVQVAFAGETATDLAGGGAVPQATNALGLAIRRVRDRSAIQTLLNAQILNATTQRLSASFDCSPYTKGIFYLDLAVSAGAPASITLSFEFSDDGGTTWFQFFDADFWPLTIQDLENAPFTRAFAFQCPGRLVRARADAPTDASNTITVTLTAEFFD